MDAGADEVIGLFGCWTVGNAADEDDAAWAGADGFAGPESSSSTPAWRTAEAKKIGTSRQALWKKSGCCGIKKGLNNFL